MFKNYLTTAYRHLLRYKLDSLLNISGLVIGLTAYLLMSNWLQQYPFRIGNGWIVLICFLAGLLASVVVVMTVGSQAWSVARANPIKAIRHE